MRDQCFLHLAPATRSATNHNVLHPCLPVFTLAAAEGIRELLLPQAEYFNTLGLPEVGNS